jgi:5-methylcytosine-specific restriction endonuclease McrA
MTRLALVAVAAILLASPADAHVNRNPEVPRQFQHAHPCPSTGRTSGACPGYQRDHVVPLCRGGADAVGNMQWLTVEAHRAKTRIDVRSCTRRGL